MREFNLIANHLAPLAAKFEGSLGLRDDAALIRVPEGHELVVTKDAISQGVHFIGDEDAILIAKKLMRTNLSDLAAKGAKPLCYMLGLMLPDGTTDEWVEEFAKGLLEEQQMFGLHLIGGDTIKIEGPFCASITAFGLIKSGRAMLRKGAKPGDRVYVTGTLGDSAIGLALLQNQLRLPLANAHTVWLKDRYLLPQPRMALGQALVGIAHACMDISDGLVQDLGHLCDVSGVRAVLHRKLLPLSVAAATVISSTPGYWHSVLSGGDDYELLFTAPSSAQEDLAALSKNLRIPITAIGEIIVGEGVVVQDEHGRDVTPDEGGYSHL